MVLIFRFCMAVSKPLNPGWYHGFAACVTNQVNIMKKDTSHDGQILSNSNVESMKVLLTVTLCSPVRLGHSHSSWLSDRVRTQGVSPISTV